MDRSKPKKRGRKSLSDANGLVDDALRHFDEFEYLEACDLGRLQPVRDLAERDFDRSFFPLAFAIRLLITEAASSVSQQFRNVSAYGREIEVIDGLLGGLSIVAISKGLGLSREHVTRTVKPRAVNLITRAFLVNVRCSHATNDFIGRQGSQQH